MIRFTNEVHALSPLKPSDLSRAERCEASGGSTVDMDSQMGYLALDPYRCDCPGVGVIQIDDQWPGCVRTPDASILSWVIIGSIILGLIVIGGWLAKNRQRKLGV